MRDEADGIQVESSENWVLAYERTYFRRKRLENGHCTVAIGKSESHLRVCIMSHPVIGGECRASHTSLSGLATPPQLPRPSSPVAQLEHLHSLCS